MGVALKSLSAGHNPVQAAASGLLMSREGDDFSMNLTFSARGTGQPIWKSQDILEMEMDNPDEHLYCLFSEVFVCGNARVCFPQNSIVGADDVMISAFQDHMTEFFIR